MDIQFEAGGEHDIQNADGWKEAYSAFVVDDIERMGANDDSADDESNDLWNAKTFGDNGNDENNGKNDGDQGNIIRQWCGKDLIKFFHRQISWRWQNADIL